MPHSQNGDGNSGENGDLSYPEELYEESEASTQFQLRQEVVAQQMGLQPLGSTLNCPIIQNERHSKTASTDPLTPAMTLKPEILTSGISSLRK